MVDKVPVSDLCNELGLQPSVFYQWQRQALENLAGAFSTPADEGPSKREKELVAKTKELEAKLAKKDNVIAEVTEELVATAVRRVGASASDRADRLGPLTRAGGASRVAVGREGVTPSVSRLLFEDRADHAREVASGVPHFQEILQRPLATFTSGLAQLDDQAVGSLCLFLATTPQALTIEKARTDGLPPRIAVLPRPDVAQVVIG
jgi:transposase-like protein